MLHKHFEDTIKLSKQATAFNEELFANECAVGDVLVLVGFLDLDKDFSTCSKYPFAASVACPEYP